jgi:hypothetical protein
MRPVILPALGRVARGQGGTRENVESQHAETKIGILQRQFVFLRRSVAALALVWLATVAWIIFRVASVPPVLAVERLEIVEPDGKPAFVLANSQRPIAATIDGQITMQGQEEERRGIASIIFFDGKGDEVGGMLFGVRETPNGFSATRHLSLDGYGQDQTVVLSHYQDPSGSTSGLTISNRPEHSLLDTAKKLGLGPGASRQQLVAAIQAIPEDQRAAKRRELFGTTRAFFGSARTGEARLELRDGEGRVRIVIEVPNSGDPVIRILDEKGQVALRLPK